MGQSRSSSAALTLTTVYDNTALLSHLTSGWGFSCLINDDLLFDTGADGPTLLANMNQLGIDPLGIKTVVLSHAHGDHTGGLAGLLATGARPAVYVPGAFPQRFQADISALTTLVQVRGPAEIQPGIHTTGEVGPIIVEQALAIESSQGLVVITGCAHPGIVEQVRRAHAHVGGEIALVLGGFHLGGASRQDVERIIADFRELGVRQVTPSHCTGDRAMRTFAGEYGADFIQGGVGLTLDLGS